MECLGMEVLCLHLDNELDAQRNEGVAEHLRTCQSCADKLRRLQEHDEFRRGVWLRQRATGDESGACYSEAELSAYISGILTPQEEENLERHLFTCDVCLREVMAARRTLSFLKHGEMLPPPARLVQAVNRGFGADQTSRLEKLGTLIIQVATDGLRFIEATLLPPHVGLTVGGHAMPASAFRSPQEPTEAAALLDIRQTVRDLELRIRALHETKDTVLLKIQIQKHGKSLANRRVSLASHAHTLYSKHTSNQGEVVFPRLLPGDYTITIVQDNLETQVILRSPPGETRER